MTKATSVPPVMIDAWLDLGDPNSYLALVSLRRALSETGFGDDFQVALHPGRLRGEPEALAVKTLDGASDVEAASAALGIRFASELPPLSNQEQAHRLIMYTRSLDTDSGRTSGPGTLELRAAEGIMRTLFEVGGNIERPETLIGIAQDLQLGGAEVSAALADLGLAEAVREAHEMGLYLGIEQTPVFLFDETYVVEGYQTEEAFRNILTTARSARAGAEGK